MIVWEEEFGTGRCINCGFLGKRDQQPTISACYEATSDDRRTGQLTELLGPHTSSRSITSRPKIATRAWCFVHKAHFSAELVDVGAQESDADKVLEVISKDRACPSWYPWREFSNPKEHFDESMTLALEQRREDFEERMEQKRRDFEVALQRSNEEQRTRSDRVMRWLAVGAIVLAIAEVVAALLGITPDSWIVKLFN